MSYKYELWSGAHDYAFQFENEADGCRFLEHHVCDVCMKNVKFTEDNNINMFRLLATDCGAEWFLEENEC